MGIKLTTVDAALTGRKIRCAMEQGGYSIKELQGILGLSCPQSVYRWVNGQSLPSIDNLYMLSRIFGVRMEDLLVPRSTGRDSG